MCPSRTKGVSFYSVPHYQENAYHLHNDNFMPTSTNILSTPCLCDGVELSSCNRIEKTNVRTPQLKQKHGSTNPEFLDVFNTLFNHTLHLNKGAHGTNLGEMRVGFIFHAAFMRDVKPLRDAWAAEGIHMNDWRYNGSDSLKKMVGSLSGYDIYLGVHGAELTNVLYGNQGLVLVEVMSEGWDKARRGGFIKLRTLPASRESRSAVPLGSVITPSLTTTTLAKRGS
ncbi:unnamed protein product [Ectocarpus sp. CCAP 1310/34]|nr:unnamed protein product [Ectocarpus sp. CCAP 1310/34]